MLDPQPTHGLFNLNHYRMYDGWLAAHRDGGTFIRLQMNFLHNQGFIAALGEQLENQLPELRERLRNQFPFFGDEWCAPAASASGPRRSPLQTANPNGYAVWREAQRLVAQARWRNENAQAGSKTNRRTSTRSSRPTRQCDADFGIKDLRWGLQHADFATEEQLARLKALNVAISVSGHRWLGGTPSTDGLPNGTMFDRIKASGIRWALHQDGVHIATHNPLFALHYAITGLNVAGRHQRGTAAHPAAGAARVHPRCLLVSQPGERPGLDRAGQVRRPGRARQGLLQGERRRACAASARSSPSSTARSCTTPAWYESDATDDDTHHQGLGGRAYSARVGDATVASPTTLPSAGIPRARRSSGFFGSPKNPLEATPGHRGVCQLHILDGGGVGGEEALDLFQEPGGDVHREVKLGSRSGNIVRPAKLRRCPAPPMPCSSMSIRPL